MQIILLERIENLGVAPVPAGSAGQGAPVLPVSGDGR